MTVGFWAFAQKLHIVAFPSGIKLLLRKATVRYAGPNGGLIPSPASLFSLIWITIFARKGNLPDNQCLDITGMTRLFRLRNKGKFSWWVIARDLERATDLSMSIKRAYKRENISLVGDQTEFYLNSKYGESLRKLLEADVEGFAGIRIPLQSKGEWICNLPPKATH